MRAPWSGLVTVDTLLHEGPVVLRVVPGSPADKAAFVKGHVVTAVGGRRITRTEELLAAITQEDHPQHFKIFPRERRNEVIGKLKVSPLSGDLTPLLTDPDAFVVKKVLVALSGLNARPAMPQLAELARRWPSLRGDAVEMMAQTDSDETVQAVRALYDGGDIESRAVILNALGIISPNG